MSTQLRAKVRRSHSKAFWVINFTGVPNVTLLPQFALTWPEAMQVAESHLAILDRKLMDEVHASRASRRERCVECGETVAPGKAHWKLNEEGCMILPADQIDPDTAEATYTMERTA